MSQFFRCLLGVLGRKSCLSSFYFDSILSAFKLPSPTRTARTWLRARLRRWMEARLTRQDTQALTQRNVYILPTPAGWMLALTLLILLLASINYQLNLGYVLTFMLAGAAIVGMHVAHATLRGIKLHLKAPAPAFAQQNALFTVELHSTSRRTRYGIGMAVLDDADWVWTDVPAQSMSSVQLGFVPQTRGRQPVPTLTAQTLFPLGTFRVWTVWCPAAQLLVYPTPESAPPPLPAGQPSAGGAYAAAAAGSGEFDGVRAYRRGDAMKQIVWKKAAKSDELVSRDSQQMQTTELWLDYQTAGSGLSPEQRYSRLCAWVLDAAARDLRYGLRLPSLEIAPDSGSAQQERCLTALALA